MMLRRKNQNQGYTLIEVLVCLVMVMVITGPAYRLFLVCVETRLLAGQVNQSITDTECLLNDIKVQMKINIEKAVETKQDEILPEKQSLEVFFDAGEEYLREKYHLDQYAYEVIFFELNEDLLADGQLNITAENLADSYCILSDSEVSESGAEEVMIIQAEPEVIKKVKEKTNEFMSYMGHNGREVKVLDSSKVYILDEEIKIVQQGLNLEADKISISRQDETQFKGFTLEYTGDIKENKMHKDYVSIINLKVDTDKPAQGITVEIINNSDINLIIRLKGKEAEKISIKVKDIKEGNTLITKGESDDIYYDYLIAVIVRDKKPHSGKKGKVIKKMLDYYSYRKSD